MSTAICVSLFVVSDISKVASGINEGKLVSGKYILRLVFLHYGEQWAIYSRVLQSPFLLGIGNVAS